MTSDPTPAELGLDVTIGIAAVAHVAPDYYIVAASDQRISFYDLFPATGQGAKKIHQITADGKWFLAFAASDVSLVLPILMKIIRDLRPVKPEIRDQDMVKKIVVDAYSEIRREEFAARHLAQLNYKTMDQFRKEGLQDLGRDEHAKIIDKLDQFDLGVELIIFGFNEHDRPCMFGVKNPGVRAEYNQQGYTVVGSGGFVALGSLRQRPMPIDLESVIYRVLEAKFVSESASNVGRTTNLVILTQNGPTQQMTYDEIEEIRAVWERIQNEPAPSDALDAIRQSSAVRMIDRNKS